MMSASKSDRINPRLTSKRVVLYTLIAGTLGMGLGLYSSLMREPLFLANLVLRVGEVSYVTNSGLVQRSVERSQEFVERLRYEHRLKGTAKKRMPLPRLHRARLSRTDSNLVILEAYGDTEAATIGFLDRLGAKTIKEHGAHFGDADSLWKKRHLQLHKHLRIIDTVIDKQLKVLDEAPDGNDQIHALRLMQMGMLTSHRAKADEDLHLLNISRSRFYTTPTRVLQQPVAAVPVGLARTPSAVAGALAGGLIGFLIGFLTGGLRRDDKSDQAV
jgi:hypothetical protein